MGSPAATARNEGLTTTTRFPKAWTSHSTRLATCDFFSVTAGIAKWNPQSPVMLVSSLLLTLESNVLPLMSWELSMKLIFNTNPLWLDPSAPGDTGSYWYDPISGFSIDLRCLGTTRYVYLPCIHYTMIQYINWYTHITYVLFVHTRHLYDSLVRTPTYV